MVVQVKVAAVKSNQKLIYCGLLCVMGVMVVALAPSLALFLQVYVQTVIG
jgi:hypothetical protein